MRLGRILLIVLAIPAFAATNPSLEKASKLFAELNYTEAQAATEAALKQPGNDRQTLLKILELQAIVLATINQSARATQVFSQLLTLSPEFTLTGNHPPRVTTAFYEARAWASAAGKLEARALDALVEPGNVKAVRVEVTKDPAKLVKKVRFFISGAQVVSPLIGNSASAAPKVPAVEVTWWAQLLSDRDAVLDEVGSASWPKNESAPAKAVVEKAPAPAPVVVAKAPEPKPAAVAKPPEPKPAQAPLVVVKAPEPKPADVPLVTEPVVEAEASTPAGRIAAFGLIGGSAVCLGIGIAFGAMAGSTRAQVDNAPTNAASQVLGMNQRQAYELDAKQRVQATVANGLYIAAAALAVGGGALLLFSGPNEAVALVPTGPGLAVVGAFP